MKKMKRFLVALLSCVTAIACVAGLSACNKEQPTSSSTPAVSSSSSQQTDSSDSSTSSEHVHSGGTATCTAKAVCAECNEEYGELADHAWSEVAEVKANCTVDGTAAHFDCDNCDALAQGEEKTAVTAEDLVIAAGHVWNEVAEVAATCTAEGKEAHFVCECGALAQGEDKTVVTAEDLVVEMLAHTYGDWTITKDPTEEAVGSAERACECSAKETAELPVLTDLRVWGPVPGKEPTCTEAGYKKYSSVYGEVTVEYPVVEHTYVWTIAVNPTEEAVGSLNGVCACSATTTAELAVLTDLRVWTPVPGKEPTCTEAGYKKYSSVYGEVTVDYPVVEHTYGAWTITVDPTEETVGSAEKACECGAKETVELAVLTDLRVWGLVPGLAPTCTEAGYKKYSSVYGEVTVESPATGHTVGAFVPGKGASCVEEGNYAYYECVNCDAKVDAEGVDFEATIPAYGHDLVNAYDLVKAVVAEDMMLNEGFIGGELDYLVAVVMGVVFPDGRMPDGIYCNFGKVCANCFDARAYYESVIYQEISFEEEYEDEVVFDLILEGVFPFLNDIYDDDVVLNGYYELGLGHIAISDATCNKGEVCGRCLREFGEPDETQHVEAVAATCSTLAICAECGEEYGEYDLTVEGHNFSELVVAGALPTCFEAEHYAVYKCVDCEQHAYKAEGFVMVNDYEEGKFYYGAPRTGHTGLVAATCTADATCSACELSGEALKLDEEDTTNYVAHHVWADAETPVAPAVCGKDGVKVAHTDCVNCDVVKVAADNEAGFELKTEADVVDEAHDHTIVDATCTEDAYCACEVEGCTCEAKGAELGEDPSYLAHHVWNYVSAKIPTCTEGGKKEYYDCANCDVIAELVGEEYVIVTDETTLLTPANGHSFLAENVVVGTPKTCDTEGRKDYYTCSDCDAISLTANSQDVAKAEDLVIPASHEWGEEVEEVAKTCTTNGKEAHFVCEACGKFAQGENKTIVEEADLVIPMSHEYGEEVEEVPASCTAGTEAHFVCADCGKIFQLVGEEYVEVTEEDLVIEAVGHSNDERDRYCGNKIPCTTCGKIFEASEEGAAEHTWLEDGTCQYCDAVQESGVEGSNPDVVLPETGEDEEVEEGEELV